MGGWRFRDTSHGWLYIFFAIHGWLYGVHDPVSVYINLDGWGVKCRAHKFMERFRVELENACVMSRVKLA